MKLFTIAMVMAVATGCAGSEVRAKVYQARDNVNYAGERAQAKIRPVVKPVSDGTDRAVASLGLRDEPVKK